MPDIEQPVLVSLTQRWGPEHPPIAVEDHIFMARGVSNCYLVTTPDGDVAINTGSPHDDHRTRFKQVSDGPIRKIVFTQSHTDHIGGWRLFTGPDVETIAHEDLPWVRGERVMLQEFVRPRSRRLFGQMNGLGVPGLAEAHAAMPEPEIDRFVRDSHAFEVGGRRFELYSTPGGETLDSMIVWLPEDRAVFTGNLFGPIFGHIPNLYTIRGDRTRDALVYLRCLERVRSLEPEILITGHGDPIRGADEIAGRLDMLDRAVRHIHDRTVEGMNAGTDLLTLMGEISLPDGVDVGQGHGKVSWCVRAVWELYSGWFRFESTTELYPVPERAVWPDVVSLAGGPDPLASRAAARLAAGEPVEALRLAEMALSADPSHRGAREVELGAHELLLERSGGENFSETRWLQTEIERVRTALD